MKRLFTGLFIVSILLIALSWTNSSDGKFVNAKTIAVYNIDSILIKMPAYDSLVTIYIAHENLYEIDDSLMGLEYNRKISEFNRDSSKFSPMLKELKKHELNELHDRLREYRQAVMEELEVRKRYLLEPLKEKIRVAAAETGKKDAYLAVIFTEGYVQHFSFQDWDWGHPVQPAPVLVNQIRSNALTYLDPKIKTVNITKEIALKMGCKP
jgi:hypothetical protein